MELLANPKDLRWGVEGKEVPFSPGADGCSKHGSDGCSKHVSKAMSFVIW
jgi:hypothetical protein